MAVILIEATLNFLGFGVPPPYPSWGGMLSGSGRSYMYKAPRIAIWPGVAISLAVFGFTMLGDALRDLLNPRPRGSRLVRREKMTDVRTILPPPIFAGGGESYERK